MKKLQAASYELLLFGFGNGSPNPVFIPDTDQGYPFYGNILLQQKGQHTLIFAAPLNRIEKITGILKILPGDLFQREIISTGYDRRNAQLHPLIPRIFHHDKNRLSSW